MAAKQKVLPGREALVVAPQGRSKGKLKIIPTGKLLDARNHFVVFHIVKHIFRAGICCLQVELHILKPHIVGMADVKPVSRERRAEHIGLRVCINQFRHIGIGIIDGPSSRQCDFNILYQHIIDDSIRHAHNGTGQFAYTGGLHIGNNHILQFAHLRRTFTFPQAEEDGRMHILGKIEKAIKAPRAHVSEFAPQMYTMKINPDKVRDVIGKGGSVIQALTRETNTQIDLEDDGTVKIMATSKEDADAAIARIKDIVAEPEVGVIYPGVVSGIKDFGLFVKILNGFESMVHISEITGERIAKIEDTKIKEGDKVFVRYLGADKRGKTRMSMVGIDQKTGAEIEK